MFPFWLMENEPNSDPLRSLQPYRTGLSSVFNKQVIT